MPEPAIIVPASFNAGDTVRWRMAPAAFTTSDGWQLRCIFVCASAKKSLTAVPDEQAFVFTVSAADSAAWPAETYRWRVRAVKGADEFTVSDGLCVVASALTQGAVTLSPVRRALQAVQEYLASPGNLSAASYTIAGRSLSRYSLPELWQHHDRLKQEVAREDAALRSAQGLAPSGRVYVRFGR